jgi:superfamily II DNA or RNA helicase
LSPKILLIADEAHNMGASSLLKLLPKINFKRRIGLSATPERQYDDEGNQKLFSFFKSNDGYTYEYSMKQAIDNRVLCKYYYYPHLVRLTDDEMNDYMSLSLKIAKYFSPQKDKFNINDSILTALLLKRKRIIHKATNKKDVFKEILIEHYQKKGSLKYTLVYVPEGNDPNDFYETDVYSETDQLETDNEAFHLIDDYTQMIKELDKRITTRKFISSTDDKGEILPQFANGEIDVLTSMKCLDEGVDVPRAELAIFCASTGNPRQFVQRRGRILRTHPDKQFAYIHDLVVIPEVNSSSSSFEMEKSMLKKELERVRNFAMLSENSSYTVTTLLDIMNYYNLNLYNNE